MKVYNVIFIMLIIPVLAFSQDMSKFDEYSLLIIKDHRFEVYAERNGEQVHKTTEEAHVMVNYVSGDFYCGVQQEDLQLLSDEEFPEDIERPERAYFQIEGVLPMEQILYNEASDQSYRVELNLTIFDKVNPIVFDIHVKNYQQTNVGFRQFLGSADLDSRDLGFTDFYGYKPEIKIVFSFQAYDRTR